MKKGILLLICFIISSAAFATEILFQYYLPTAFGIVSGSGSTINQFEDSIVSESVLIPLEGRTNICSFGKVTLAFGFIATGYIENKVFGSMDASFGLGLYYNENTIYKLTGFNIFLYPMYDIPWYTDGRKPLVAWKTALDCGYSVFITSIPITLDVYVRNIVYWKQNRINYAIDLGIAIGLCYVKPDRDVSGQ